MSPPTPANLRAHRKAFRRAMVLASLAVALIPVATLFAATGAAPFVVVESGQRYPTLQAAVTAIGAGTGTIAIEPGSYAQCAVQRAGNVTYRATPGTVVLRSVACEGKAALVLRGASAEVDGLTFANIRVSDRNGAGIRLENGPLTVTRSVFRDSEQGIMTVNGKSFSLSVDRSTFLRLGTCEGSGGCAHSIYMGDYGSLTVTRSRFAEGTGGHYVKSRAAILRVSNSSFDDSNGQNTNYMIDIANGATGAVSGNVFVQGADKDNGSLFIAVGAEGARRPSDFLAFAGNSASLAPGVTRKPVFIADWTGDTLAMSGNVLGPGIRQYERR